MLRFPKFLLFVSIILPVLAQAQFTDDFSDGDFTLNPVWEGTPGDFIVNVDSQLQLFNTSPTGADISFLSSGFTASSVDEREWQFWVKHSFSGSANNNGKFWLAVDEANPSSASATGYYLQFGEAGSDDAIELFHHDAGTSTSICRGTDGLISGSFEFRVRVRRDAFANWTVDIDPTGGTDFVNEASGNDGQILTSDRLAVMCTYTSSNAEKFYYDDIYFGDYILDTEAPELLGVSVTSSTTLALQFNEPVNPVSAAVLTNYSVNPGAGNLLTAAVNGGDDARVDLTFDADFTIGTEYEITVNNVVDLAGNPVASTTLPFIYFIVETADYRDISINEIMADQSPVVLLPEAEFIELYNRSNKYVNLQDWTLSDGSSTSTLDSSILGPNEFVIVTSTANAPLFAFYGNVMGVGSFPSWNNAGDLVELRDSAGALIDIVNYSDDWYQDEDKADGGYTLEQINPFAACSGAGNWIASNASQGGTPNTENSVFDDTPDTEAPSIFRITVIAADTVLLDFNEPILSGSLSAGSITISNGISVAGVSLIQPDLTSAQVWFTTTIDSGVVHTLTLSNLTDCEGNIEPSDSIEFVLPFEAITEELAINEILFNPSTNGTDYIEIKSRASRTIDLQYWSLADFDDDTIGTLRPITLEHFPLEAGGIVCITEDSLAVKVDYITHGIGRFIETDIPSMSNDSGTVYLISPDLEVAERFAFDVDMHFTLLDPDGVSLERIDVERSVDDRTNWHSAATDVGFGTPGLENSQQYLTQNNEGEVTTDPEIFSPDNDGHNDVLNINYRFTDIGNVGTITIYDTRGRVVRRLAENILLATEGTISWDGEQEDGQKARIGAYLIHFEVFNSEGKTADHKVSTVVGGRL